MYIYISQHKTIPFFGLCSRPIISLKSKFEYIELREILFFNYKINVVFLDDVYKNDNTLNLRQPHSI